MLMQKEQKMLSSCPESLKSKSCSNFPVNFHKNCFTINYYYCFLFMIKHNIICKYIIFKKKKKKYPYITLKLIRLFIITLLKKNLFVLWFGS